MKIYPGQLPHIGNKSWIEIKQEMQTYLCENVPDEYQELMYEVVQRHFNEMRRTAGDFALIHSRTKAGNKT